MTPTKPAHVVVQGVKGVRLKQFERVVADILPCIQPSYVLLPAKPANGDLDVESWPFHTLPAAARVWGTLEGQLAQKERATRKEAQIRSMIRCVLALLPTTKTTQRDKKRGELGILHNCGLWWRIGASGNSPGSLASLLSNRRCRFGPAFSGVDASKGRTVPNRRQRLN